VGVCLVGGYDKAIDLPYGAPARTVLAAAESAVVDTAELVATYRREG
jgi:hypothetical protein